MKTLTLNCHSRTNRGIDRMEIKERKSDKEQGVTGLSDNL